MQAVPTVALCTQPFRTLAQMRREALGLPTLPIIYLPHPMMTRKPQEIEQFADQVLPDVVRYLTEAPQ